MIAATVLYITLLTPAGERVDVLPMRFDTRAACMTEKAATHAATLPGVTTWRLVAADCKPLKGTK